jgi:hypothetical protein
MINKGAKNCSRKDSIGMVILFLLFRSQSALRFSFTDMELGLGMGHINSWAERGSKLAG